MEMQRGSPQAEILLAQLDWVRHLAGALVRDPALADDVAQDAWLAALSSDGPRGSAPRAWLAAVTRNAARLRAQRERRRRDVEPAAAREQPLPPTDALVEGAAVQRSLVDHVLALPDPYRRALLLRYFEGLAPADIAELRLDEDVVLAPPLELEVALVPPDEEEEELWGREVLLPDGVTVVPEALWLDGASATFDARREFVLCAAETGAQRVRWTLRAPAPEGGFRRVRSIEGREALLRIDAADRFAVAPDLEALERARLELERVE